MEYQDDRAKGLNRGPTHQPIHQSDLIGPTADGVPGETTEVRLGRGVRKFALFESGTRRTPPPEVRRANDAFVVYLWGRQGANPSAGLGAPHAEKFGPSGGHNGSNQPGMLLP
jgi:hypothetical protein